MTHRASGAAPNGIGTIILAGDQIVLPFLPYSRGGNLIIGSIGVAWESRVQVVIGIVRLLRRR